THLIVEFDGSFQGSPRVHGTEVVESIKNWTVEEKKKRIHALGEGLDVLGSDSLQEIDILLGMEAAHVVRVCSVWAEYLRGLLITNVTPGNAIRPSTVFINPGCSRTIVEISYVRVPKIHYIFLGHRYI
ncbi:unnamed protein product, partial [Ixodes persulcatus]